MAFDPRLPETLPECPTTWALDTQLCAQSNPEGFFEFCKLAWPQVENVPLVCERHMYELAQHYQALAQGRLPRLLVNVPPGFSKSVMACVLLPAWIWTWWPGARILTVSYDAKLVSRDSEKARNLILSDWYQARWPLELSTSKAKLYYRNKDHGYRLATTIRGGLTGFHFDVAIVDDPQKPLGLARSTVEAEGIESETAWTWYSETLPSRFSDHETARKLVIMQRLSMGDLAQKVLESDEPYEHLCLPMRYDPDRHSRTSVGGDWRTEQGELLAPQRFSEIAVRKLEAGMGARVRAAQLQQDPTPAEGVYFRAEDFGRWHALPKRPYWLTAWDFAVKEKSGSWNVGQCWARDGKERYLIAQTRFKGDTVAMLHEVRRFHDECAERFDKLQKQGALRPTPLGILVEDKASGPAIMAMLKDQDYDAELHAFDVGRASKEERAEAVKPTVQAGRVSVPGDGSLDEVVSRICAFPGHRDKDEVDVLSMVLLHWMSSKSDGQAFLDSLPMVR